MPLIVLPLLLLGIGLNAAAQLLLKIGMEHIGHFAFAWSNAWPIGLRVATSPWVILGFTCYFISAALWVLVLSRVDVSIAYPMVSLGYVFTAVAAYFLLGEHISAMRMLGILVILFGVYLVARS